VLAGHQNSVFGLRFTAAGNQLISASHDRTLRVWDLDTGVTLRVLQGHSAGVGGIALHGDSLFSASNDGTVRRWSQALPAQQVLDLPNSAISTAIAPDGHSLVVGFADGALRFYALPDLRLLGEEKQAHTQDINRLVFNREGHWLAAASMDNTATVWQLDSQHLTKRYTLTGHTDVVYAVAFSPDSTLLATASYDGQIGLFTLGTEKQRLFKAHDGKVASVTFDNTGTRLLSSGYEDFTIRLWNLTTDPPTLLQEFPKAQDMLLWATLSPDQQWVASVGREHIVTLYATATAPVQHRLVGHEQTVFRAIFSPDSSQLVTVGGDATVKLWEVKTGKELFTLRLPTNPHPPTPLWDFDFRCMPQGDCWIAVPLTRGKLVVYGLGKYE
jgi:WD40 repeat protein